MKAVRRAARWGAALAVLTALSALLLASCSALPAWLPGFAPTPTLKSSLTPTPTHPASAATQPAPVSTLAVPDEMTLWLPPEFNPEGEGQAAALLKQRLDEFEQAHQITLTVRLKAPSGPGGLIESLAASAAAAPLAQPALAALSRSDLEAAALKGLLAPLEGSTTVLQGEDWYDYARQLARVQDATFGIPFAGDGLLLIYRPSLVSPAPAAWETILNLRLPVGFPAANPQALTTLALYQSLGGKIQDNQGRPALESARLAQVYDLYNQAAIKGIFPPWLTQMDSDAQIWQAYQDGKLNAAITWSSYFLTNLPADTTALPLADPAGGKTSSATGWSWVVTDPIPERRAIAVQLAEWLSDPAFLGPWTEAAGYLPTRPSALELWRDGTLRAVLAQVALNARARPSNDLLSSLGPVLRDTSINVIRLESAPVNAADTASQRITSPSVP